jgi:hypothetical protein
VLAQLLLLSVGDENGPKSLGEQNLRASFPLHFAARALFGLTLASVLHLTVACQYRGVVSSGTLFNFWLVTAICLAPELHHKISTVFQVISFYCYYLKKKMI